MVIGQFERLGVLFLECVEKPGAQVVTFPASITDYSTQTDQTENTALNLEMKTHFTIQGLQEVAFILDSKN